MFEFPEHRGLNAIKKGVGRETYLEKLLFSRKVEQRYSKDSLFLGNAKAYEWIETAPRKFWYPVGEAKPYFLDIKKSFRALILGMTGSGKTFLMRAMMSRLYKSGYSVMHLSDIKNEMSSNSEPLQTEFRPKLKELSGGREVPEAIPTKQYLPIFLSPFYPNLPNNTELIQLDLNELTESDLVTLFGVEGETSRVDVVKEIYRNVEDGKIETFDDMQRLINSDKMKDVHFSVKNFFNRKLKDMKNKNVLSTEYSQDIVKELDKFVVSLSLKEYKALTPGYVQAYMAVIIEKIRKARRANELKKPICFFVDEAHSFIPKNSNPVCKDRIKTVINEDRLFGISMIISTQYPRQIPEEEIIRQMKYYFLPYNIDKHALHEILNLIGIYRVDDWRYDKWMKLKDKCEEYNWIAIERDVKRGEFKIFILDVAPPLCAHVLQDV